MRSFDRGNDSPAESYVYHTITVTDSRIIEERSTVTLEAKQASTPRDAFNNKRRVRREKTRKDVDLV